METVAPDTLAQQQLAPSTKWHRASVHSLRGAGLLLVTTVWVSAGLFGLYILAFYAAALYKGNLQQWNNVLPGLYNTNSPGATSSIGLHFAMGGIILLLGSIQLIEAVRVRYSAFHRWVGRVYVVSCLLAAVGGLLFIVIKGTIGGTVMNIGFAGYGVAMMVCSWKTYRCAVTKQYEKHRAWALRLYALAIGSWLYRIDYGFWFLMANKAGHAEDFRGWFDRIMSFFFYIPNLLVAQVFIKWRNNRAISFLNFLSAFGLLLLTAILLIGTYYFTKFYWGPAIIGSFASS